MLACVACAPVRVHAPAQATGAFPRTWDEPQLAAAPAAPPAAPPVQPGAAGAAPPAAGAAGAGAPLFVDPYPAPVAPVPPPAATVVEAMPPPEPAVEEEPAEDLSPFLRYLKGLAGLELSGATGLAQVSTAVNEGGTEREVANGDATSRSVRVSFWSLPDRTGFVWAPSLGFVSQEIEIADFRQHLPSVTPPQSTTIPTVASDPRTGAMVDPESPNVYQLSLKTGYLGQRFGYGLVRNRPSTRLVLMLQGILNLVEYRDLRYRIGGFDSGAALETKDRSGRWAWLQSGGTILTAAIGIKKLHLALRAELKYEVFRDFEYPKPVEFRGPARYNAGIQAFERQQLFLDKVSYQTFELVAGASVYF